MLNCLRGEMAQYAVENELAQVDVESNAVRFNLNVLRGEQKLRLTVGGHDEIDRQSEDGPRGGSVR